MDLFQKQARGKFILKCVGAIVRMKDKVIVTNNIREYIPSTIPYIVPQNGQNQKDALETHLKRIKLNLVLRENPSIKRLVLKRDKKIQRVNFILFNGVLKSKSVNIHWISIKNDLFLSALVK